MDSAMKEQMERYGRELLDYGRRGGAMPAAKIPAAEITGDKIIEAKTPVEEQYRLYALEHPKTGYIRVQAFVARHTYPVENALVEISKAFEQGRHILGEYRTDNAGMTPTIEVPAAEKSLSLHPGERQPYSAFDIIVRHPDYATVHLSQVPVFEGVVSLQSVELQPAAATPQGEKTIEETEPSDL